MNIKHYYLKQVTTKKELKKVVVNVLSQTKYIYFMLPDFYSELKKQVFDKHISIFENDEFLIGYIEDNDLDYLYEFFVRGISLPFVITDKKIDCSFQNAASYNYDMFYDLFKGSEISHMKLGPDGGSFIYLEY